MDFNREILALKLCSADNNTLMDIKAPYYMITL